ncbi:MAG: SLBB domain-containing protein [Candidatus Atribacteria bacterium]|nr:SLBB domain-containing protein [Candidatus Atribacteria bacterium]
MPKKEQLLAKNISKSKNISRIIIFTLLVVVLVVGSICLFSNTILAANVNSENPENKEQNKEQNIEQQPPDYVLNYKDVLEIRLWGYPELTSTVTVQPDGMMSLPLDGQIYAAGKTLEEVRTAIVQEMKRVLPSLESSQVSLTVISFSTTDISVLGEVKTPGLFPISGKANVLRAISFAGGLTQNAGLKNATIIRDSGEVIPVDLEKLFYQDDMSQNYQLFSGDSLYVPKAFELSTISVGGEVKSPGLYSLEGRVDVLKAISAANGFTSKADLKNAIVSRQNGEVVPVNLERLLLENDLSQNVILEYGDSLFIPMTLENNIYVLGEVKSPGLYAIEGSCSLIEAISLAGGYSDKARLDSCLVIREYPSDQEGLEMRTITLKEVKVIREENEQVFEINLKKILKDGELAQNITLQPQDIVYLPTRPLSELNIENTLDIIQTSISIYSILK